ncbi:hypothetical protein [Microbacterium halophytorum]|uniref:hypothetical protein n=1 Tax=Microbacterium halophytorum TaxID=2067568 RepID=UPI000CFBCF21|nr:hypothetical protein [Microbacterium halophytorum]
MRKKILMGSALIGLSVLLAACGGADAASDDEQMDGASSEQMDNEESMDSEDMADESMESDEMSEESMGEARSGALAGDKMVAGSVTVADGTVELTEFSADGMGLHLYLAEGDDAMAAEAGLDLGKLADDAEQTFDAMGDTASYTHAVVFSPEDGEVYAVAELM